MNDTQAHNLPSAFCLLPFEEGIRLFNEQAFWHAHEQWETCWRVSVEPDSTFYKGIIQTAAALVHWQKGNPRGLRRNWFKARPKLVALPAEMRGIDIHALIEAMDHFVLTDGLRGSAPQVRYRAAGNSAAQQAPKV